MLVEYVTNQSLLQPAATESKTTEERTAVDELRGSPMAIGSLEEIIDDDHAIISSANGPEYYVSIMSFVDKDLLEPGCAVLLHNKTNAIVGVLADDVDPMVSVMKLDKAPTESYADIGGLETQIQEIKESVELPLTHPELYEEMGIRPPKGVILYGVPGTGKTLLAKAVANQTSATFLRIVGSELIQKYLGDGPKLVRELFRVAEENAPSIIFIDEIDAIGTKRYDSTSGGEREIQRTMLELLNQLDGFDTRGDVKVIMATNKIESLDPALIRPGRIDRKIEFPLPDVKVRLWLVYRASPPYLLVRWQRSPLILPCPAFFNLQTKRHIFRLHTSRMTLGSDVDLEEYIMAKDELSGADIKAVCTEAGLMALRERRMRVTKAVSGKSFSTGPARARPRLTFVCRSARLRTSKPPETVCWTRSRRTRYVFTLFSSHGHSQAADHLFLGSLFSSARGSLPLVGSPRWTVFVRTFALERARCDVAYFFSLLLLRNKLSTERSQRERATRFREPAINRGACHAAALILALPLHERLHASSQSFQSKKNEGHGTRAAGPEVGEST